MGRLKTVLTVHNGDAFTIRTAVLELWRTLESVEKAPFLRSMNGVINLLYAKIDAVRVKLDDKRKLRSLPKFKKQDEMRRELKDAHF